MGSAEAAAALRDTGAALALDAEARKHELIWAVTKAARSFPTFTSDDVWGILEEIGVHDLHHPNAMGATFLMAARAGTIEATGKVQKSIRTGAHRRNVQVWASRIFQGVL
jgi:hypothetical protein